MISENVGASLGFGQRVDPVEAEELWEAWSVQFRTNAFRRPRPVQWHSSGEGEGVALFSTHPTARVWVAVCVWRGRAECFVHRPASGTTYRTCPWLRDEAWAEPRLFAGELTESGELWLEDVADRRLGDWSRRRAWCERWVQTMAPSAGWKVKPATSSAAANSALLLDSPLDGFRVVAAVSQAAGKRAGPVDAVWKAIEGYEVGMVLVDGAWHLPRFPEVAVYRAVCDREQTGEEAPCRCVWNERMRCWDVLAFC